MPIIGHCRKRSLFFLQTQCLVQPSALESLLEYEMLVPRDHSNGLDQSLAIGLDRKVLELPARFRNCRQRAARGRVLSMPMYRSIGGSSRWVLLNFQLEDVR